MKPTLKLIVKGNQSLDVSVFVVYSVNRMETRPDEVNERERMQLN